MIINLSPVRMDEELQVRRDGDRLELNGEVFDFEPLLEGATLPRDAMSSKWFSGPVDRLDGELVVNLVLPHGANAPVATRYPQPIMVTGDGLVDLPVYDEPADLDEVLQIAEEPAE